MGAVSKKTVRDHLSARVAHPLYSIPLALPTISNSIGPNRSVPHRNGITDGMLSLPKAVLDSHMGCLRFIRSHQAGLRSTVACLRARRHDPESSSLTPDRSAQHHNRIMYSDGQRHIQQRILIDVHNSPGKCRTLQR